MSGQAPIAVLVRHLVGGKEKFMEFAELVSQIEPKLGKVVETYHGLTKEEQKRVSLDGLCYMNNVDPVHFIGVVGEAAVRYRDNAAVVMIALGMPEVIAKSLKMASAGDWHHTKMLFEHAGIVPTPAGQTINVTANAAAKAESAVENEVRGLPTFEKTILDTDAIIRDRE